MKSTEQSEFLQLLEEISQINLTVEEWSERESSDMFRSRHFSGGYEALEGEFVFSYFPPDGGEFWFGISLTAVQKAVKVGQLPDLAMRAAG